jgi:hypothetical protein
VASGRCHERMSRAAGCMEYPETRVTRTPQTPESLAIDLMKDRSHIVQGVCDSEQGRPPPPDATVKLRGYIVSKRQGIRNVGVSTSREAGEG